MGRQQGRHLCSELFESHLRSILVRETELRRREQPVLASYIGPLLKNEKPSNVKMRRLVHCKQARWRKPEIEGRGQCAIDIAGHNICRVVVVISSVSFSCQNQHSNLCSLRSFPAKGDIHLTCPWNRSGDHRLGTIII